MKFMFSLRFFCLLALVFSGIKTLSATSLYRPEPLFVLDGEDAAPWERIERHRDFHPRFPRESFLAKLVHFYPQVIKGFGTNEPHSSNFLLHVAPGWDKATKPYPVLLIPGANDDATRRYAYPTSTQSEDHTKVPGLMQYLSERGFAVFSISFSHYHGDNIYQGEHVANAITRIKTLLNRQDDPDFKVDLVTYSKGAMAARAYVQSAAEYYQRNFLTEFRHDVRRVVFQCGPIGGLDMMYRYYMYNLAILSQDIPAPVGTESLMLYGRWVDSGDMHILSGYWPGQLQMLHDQRELGVNYGPTSWTTDMNMSMSALRDGGSSMFLKSKGLESARKAGGKMIEILNERGFPPDVSASLLAGNKFIIYDERYPGWKIPVGIELSAPSDGLVYVKSALYEEGLTARGAVISGKKLLPLNHIELSHNVEAFSFVESQLSAD